MTYPFGAKNLLWPLPEMRYTSFLKMIVRYGKVWGLYCHGWALAEDDDDKKLIPLWPKKRYAQFCATGQWEGCRPREISLDDFLSENIDEIYSSGLFIAAFYTPEDKGSIILDKNALKNDIINMQKDLKSEEKSKPWYGYENSNLSKPELFDLQHKDQFYE